MHDKVLIVTGSTRIGAAAARMAAGRGARVLIATADGATGWELAQETGAECWTGELTLPGAAESVVSQCLGRFGRIDALLQAVVQVEDVARTALYLLGETAGSITGQVVNIDGGWSVLAG